jgi:hypothetical protein
MCVFEGHVPTQHRLVNFHPAQKRHFLDLNYSKLQTIFPRAAHSVD